MLSASDRRQARMVEPRHHQVQVQQQQPKASSRTNRAFVTQNNSDEEVISTRGDVIGVVGTRTTAKMPACTWRGAT